MVLERLRDIAGRLFPNETAIGVPEELSQKIIAASDDELPRVVEEVSNKLSEQGQGGLSDTQLDDILQARYFGEE